MSAQKSPTIPETSVPEIPVSFAVDQQLPPSSANATHVGHVATSQEATIPTPEVTPSAVRRFLGRVGIGSRQETQGRLSFVHPEQPVNSHERMKGEWVKHAPQFQEQVADETRTNILEYVHTNDTLGTGNGRFDAKTAHMTEHEALVQLRLFLQNVVIQKPHLGEKARSMLDNLTFIGKKEYDEAAGYIADVWRKKLLGDPEAQICVVSGKIDMVGHAENNKVKSDAFLLDSVLQHYDDETMKLLKGRLVLDPSELSAKPNKVDLIILDDWSISGEQFEDTASQVVSEYPRYKDRVQIQSIAASEERLKHGILAFQSRPKHVTKGTKPPKPVHIPLNAYYVANEAPHTTAPTSHTHITGSHCSVDFDFSQEIVPMAGGQEMPALATLIRPYRKQGFQLHNVERLRAAS